MSIAEMLPAIRSLPQHEKLRLLHFIASELNEEGIPGIRPGADYPIWSPLNAYEAAKVLDEFLKEKRDLP